MGKNLNKHTKEIISLAKTSIHNRELCNNILEAVFRNQANEARLLSDKLRTKYPYNKAYVELDNLILDKFYG